MASLFFYGWWNPLYLGLILVSIIFNYVIGSSLERKPSKFILVSGITTNLLLLAYFKYANFFVNNLNILINGDIHLEKIILPLAISFFTFQQITYLIDSYRGLTKGYNFLHYCLFVTFFPQLIAGPIVHHAEMMPQFKKINTYRFSNTHLSVGITLFMFGLFKKVVLADGIAVYATPIFQAAENGLDLTIFEAWIGALAYTFQLYFDFSGYSDMALGLARMFGITLPVNFFSPYKAKNIIEFWRRWHITLHRFITNYVFFPLDLKSKRFLIKNNITISFSFLLNPVFPIMTAFLISGLWHGAGWTFIIWGGMHGIYLSINYFWHNIRRKILNYENKPSLIGRYFGHTLTFISVVLAWVMFRAETLEGSKVMYMAMLGYNGISFPPSLQLFLGNMGNLTGSLEISFDGLFYHGYLVDPLKGVFMILSMLLIVWFAPNTNELMRNYKPVIGFEHHIKKYNFITWAPNRKWLITVSIISYLALSSLFKVSEFLYFQF
tara:strand:+ start:1566 stop:3047 length:1482 start_codon:yes stop_codon:yes gene_type:complete